MHYGKKKTLLLTKRLCEKKKASGETRWRYLYGPELTDKDYYQDYVSVFYELMVKQSSTPLGNGERIWEIRRYLPGQ